MQNFSAGVVGNLVGFTEEVTKPTNPQAVYIPPPQTPDYALPHQEHESIFSGGEPRGSSIWRSLGESSSSSSSSSHRSSSSGSSHRSCACACAGCACACAGGGR